MVYKLTRGAIQSTSNSPLRFTDQALYTRFTPIIIMVLARYGDVITPEDAKLLGESITMPFSGKVAKSRFFKAGV
jgi:hypothetical protein